MIRTTVYIPVEVHADLGRLSAAWWMSVSELVRLAVSHAFSEEFEKLRNTAGIAPDLEARRKGVAAGVVRRTIPLEDPPVDGLHPS